MDLMSTAQVLGNFGEFVGAIAVVATLGYLAVQIRQNTRSLDANRRLVRVQMQQELTRNLQQVNYQALENKESASIFVRGGRDPGSLDEVESRIYTYQLDGYFNENLNVLQLVKDGFLGKKFLDLNESFLISEVLCEKGALEYWKTYQYLFPADQRERINGLLALRQSEIANG